MTDANFKNAGFVLMTGTKNNFSKENICPSVIWLKGIFTLSVEDVHLRERIRSKMVRIYGIMEYSPLCGDNS